MNVKSKIKNNRGQGLIEYIIIVAIIAVGSISLIRVLHQGINVQFARIARSMGAREQAPIKAPEITSTMLQKKDLTNFMNGARSGKGDQSNDLASENN